MIKTSNIDTSSVTPEQIGRCHKCFSGSVPFYMVESESDSSVEYKVTWDKKHGYRCTCPSGNVGFSNCKAGFCKHCRWAYAASMEERQAIAELNAAIAEKALQASVQAAMSDERTKQEAEKAKNAPVKVPASKRETAPYQPRPFSILR